MSQTVDFAQLLRFANDVVNGKEYFVSTIVERLDDAAAQLPHDGAIRTAQRALSERLRKNGSLATITQRQFQTIYDEVSGLGDRAAFRELLGDLLITAAPQPVAAADQDWLNSHRDSGSVVEIADPALVAEFSGMWSGKVASVGALEHGRRGLEGQLAQMGFGSPDAEIVDRTGDFVMYSVAADSPVGRFTVYVPTEVTGDSILLPSVFASNNGLTTLNKDNLLAYARDLIEGRVKVASPAKILAGLQAVADSRQPAFVRTASGDTVAMEVPSLYQQVNEYVQPEEEELIPAMPPALASVVGPELIDSLVEAGLSYDRDTIVTAKTIVGDLIRSSGLRLERISVDSEFDGGLLVAANLIGPGGKRTVQVPVEVVGGQVLMPSVFMSGTLVESFDTASLKKFAAADDVGVFNSAFSTKSGWSYTDLYTHIMKSAAYGNFVEAEDAMAVVLNQYGPDFHKAAFTDLTEMLTAGGADSVDTVERMIAEAGERARNTENRIKMSSTLMYLIPED